MFLWFSQHTFVAHSVDRRQVRFHTETWNEKYEPRSYKNDTTFWSSKISTSVRVVWFNGGDGGGCGVM